LTLAGSGLAGRSGDAALSGAWGETLKQVLAPMQAGLAALAKAGAAIPEVGTELADADGKVVADAELCWPVAHLVLLRDDQTDLQAAWEAQGWRTMLLSDDQTLIDDQAWHVVVALHLSLTLSEE
jgi:DEAD/DEAH box helicase domain-containing protein